MNQKCRRNVSQTLLSAARKGRGKKLQFIPPSSPANTVARCLPTSSFEMSLIYFLISQYPLEDDSIKNLESWNAGGVCHPSLTLVFFFCVAPDHRVPWFALVQDIYFLPSLPKKPLLSGLFPWWLWSHQHLLAGSILCLQFLGNSAGVANAGCDP